MGRRLLIDTFIIANDGDGYDQYFQTPKTDMGRGALIIRYTNEKGEKQKPEICCILYVNSSIMIIQGASLHLLNGHSLMNTRQRNLLSLIKKVN